MIRRGKVDFYFEFVRYDTNNSSCNLIKSITFFVLGLYIYIYIYI